MEVRRRSDQLCSQPWFRDQCSLRRPGTLIRLLNSHALISTLFLDCLSVTGLFNRNVSCDQCIILFRRMVPSSIFGNGMVISHSVGSASHFLAIATSRLGLATADQADTQASTVRPQLSSISSEHARMSRLLASGRGSTKHVRMNLSGSDRMIWLCFSLTKGS